MSARRIQLKADRRSRRPAPSQASSSQQSQPPQPNPPSPAPDSPGYSTGPRTREGLIRAAQNAFKHGLTSAPGRPMVLLPTEDRAEHQHLILQFNEQFVPITDAERQAVREIADSLWLARRARDLQTYAMNGSLHDLPRLSLFLRYETAHLRAHHAAIKTLLTLQKDRRARNEHHETWNEPVLWGTMDHTLVEVVHTGPPSDPLPSTTPTASPATAHSSFRNPSAAAPVKPAAHDSRAPQSAVTAPAGKENQAA